MTFSFEGSMDIPLLSTLKIGKCRAMVLKGSINFKKETISMQKLLISSPHMGARFTPSLGATIAVNNGSKQNKHSRPNYHILIKFLLLNLISDFMFYL